MRVEIHRQEVRLVRFADPAIEFEADFSAPPGARLEARLWPEDGPEDKPEEVVADAPSAEGSAVDSAGGQEVARPAPQAMWHFRVKIHGCKRRDGGRYMLHAVAIDLRKEARSRLELWSRNP